MRIALVDDHPVFRSGLRAFLESQPDFEVVAEVENARAASLAAAEAQPDMFIVDIKLPDGDGVALVDELSRAGRRCLILTMYDDADHAARAMDAGAMGYALKSEPPERLLEAVRAVANNELWLAPSLAARLRLEPRERIGLASLSPREREVFDLAVRGLSCREIAKALFISPKTVESHRYRINHKLGVRSLAQLVRFAALRRLLTD